MSELDFLNEEQPKLNEDELKSLSELSYSQKVFEAEADDSTVNRIIVGLTNSSITPSIKTLEEVIKYYKNKLKEVKEEKIPKLMNSLGLSEIKLTTGELVKVEDKVKGSITKANILKAREAMIQAEIEKGLEPESAKEFINSFFKDVLKLETSSKALKVLLEHEFNFEQELTIPWQTLDKYCRDKISAGEDVPEPISVYKYQSTKIK